MKRFLAWFKYSGVWAGLTVNPYHWTFRWVQNTDHNDMVFENAVYFGPVWIRVVIDDGRW